MGCGRVGSELANRLVREGHSTVIIDKEARSFHRLPEGWKGRTLVGFGFDKDCLQDAEIDRAGAVAAVTSGDNSNILTARIARENYGVQNVVARIYDPRRAVIYQRLGIPTVATVTWTTDQAMRRLFPDSPNTEWTDPSGEVMLVEYAIPPHLAGRKLTSLARDGETKIVALTRANTARLAIEGLVGQEGDIVRIAVMRRSFTDLEALFTGAREL